jgi:16S rRNA (cytosine967-C5)-methyltransferase
MPPGVSVARAAALDALLRMHKKQFRVHLDDALEDVCGHYALSGRDRRLTHELIAGALRNVTLLEWHLDRVSSRPLQTLEPPIRWTLIMAAYQLLFLDRVGRHAAVHQAVELCKHGAPRAAAFVNAVLRALLRQGDGSPSAPVPLPNELAVRFSHPAWIVALYQDRCGAACPAVLAWNNAKRRHFARIRRHPAAVLAELGPAAVQIEKFGSDFIQILETYEVINSISFKQGDLYVMQPWSARVAGALPVLPGARLLDMCAAPGGKTIALADRAALAIDALEVDARRADSLRDNLRRCGVADATVHLMDAAAAAANLGPARYDAVLLDAPCSNLGVVQRHPEVRWRVHYEDVTALAATQAQLLQTAAACVRPGGHVLYAVCTLSREETHECVQSFLRHQPGFCLCKEELSYPGQFDTDGGYWALLRRAP